MPLSPSLVYPLSALGIATEAVGITIFTYDLLRAGSRAIQQLRAAELQIAEIQRITASPRFDTISVWDGSDGEEPRCEISELTGSVKVQREADPAALPLALQERKWLWVGVVLVAVGIAMQIVGTLMQLGIGS